MIKDAVDSDISEKLSKMDDSDSEDAMERLHEIVLNFVSFLEETLLNELEGEKVKPIINLIDDGSIDRRTMWLSLKQTKKILEKEAKPLADEETSVKQELLKQLLKNWKPESSEPVN
jgi:hypothetical protein